jgi:hypothetical protein
LYCCNRSLEAGKFIKNRGIPCSSRGWEVESGGATSDKGHIVVEGGRARKPDQKGGREGQRGKCREGDELIPP